MELRARRHRTPARKSHLFLAPHPRSGIFCFGGGASLTLGLLETELPGSGLSGRQVGRQLQDPTPRPSRRVTVDISGT